MADNWTAVDGSGAAITIAADEVSAAKHQRVKIEFGADGSATEVDATHPLPTGSGDSDDAAPTGGIMPVAGVYQGGAVDEVDANDVGRLRMTARRVLLEAADCKKLIFTAGTPVPTGSDITDENGGALDSTDFAIRDTNSHYYAIPLAAASWRHLQIGLFASPAFDQAATIRIYGGQLNNTLFSRLAQFTHPASSISWSIGDAGDAGQGGETGGATATTNAYYSVPAMATAWPYLFLLIFFAVAPTTGSLNLYIARST